MTEHPQYSEYIAWFTRIKSRIQQAKIKAGVAVNTTLLELYWELGKDIVEKQENSTWGSSIIDKLARDLSNEFPDMKGFSRRNIYAVRQWYLFYSRQSEFVPRPVAQIPWRDNNYEGTTGTSKALLEWWFSN